MILQYGSTQLPDGEVSVQITNRTLRSPSGWRFAKRETWQLRGIVHGDTQADITTNINARKATFGQDGQDIVLFDNNSAKTAHEVMNADCIGGTRVVAVDFPEGEGAEYATYRTYTVTIECDVRDISQEILGKSESIDVSGGGFNRVFIQTLNGPPQEQITAQQTTYKAIQSGIAIGATAYPIPNAPIWPTLIHLPQARVVKQPATIVRGEAVSFPVTWFYVFESTTDLFSGVDPDFE